MTTWIPQDSEIQALTSQVFHFSPSLILRQSVLLIHTYDLGSQGTGLIYSQTK